MWPFWKAWKMNRFGTLFDPISEEKLKFFLLNDNFFLVRAPSFFFESFRNNFTRDFDCNDRKLLRMIDTEFRFSSCRMMTISFYIALKSKNWGWTEEKSFVVNGWDGIKWIFCMEGWKWGSTGKVSQFLLGWKEGVRVVKRVKISEGMQTNRDENNKNLRPEKFKFCDKIYEQKGMNGQCTGSFHEFVFHEFHQVVTLGLFFKLPSKNFQHKISHITTEKFEFLI